MKTMKLSGRRILVVEDDYVLASYICAAFRDVDAKVLGPAPTAYYAYNLLAGGGVEGAVLDVRLHGSDVFDLAHELVEDDVPIIFATGHAGDIPLSLRSVPLLTKPFQSDHLVKMVDAMLRSPNCGSGKDMSESGGSDTRDVPEFSLETRLCLALAQSIRIFSNLDSDDDG